MQFILMTLSWFVLTASASASDPQEYRIGLGDKLNIIVHGHEEYFSRPEFVVGGDGEVSFPQVGMIRVKGLTAFEAESAVRERLMDGFVHDPHVSVQILTFKSQSVDLIGAVKEPGVYPLEGPITVRALLAKAGGINDAQSSGFVLVTRDEETVRLALSQLEGAAGNFLLRGGDVVDVDQGTNVFLAGEVMQPGAVEFTDGLTASQALLLAGGPSEFGRLGGAYVLRDEQRIRVNLKRVLKGKDADIQLEPGDRIVVPLSAL
jgi:polysaccharide export outer membrane protein